MNLRKNSVLTSICSILFVFHATPLALHAEVVFADNFQSYTANVAPPSSVWTPSAPAGFVWQVKKYPTANPITNLVEFVGSNADTVNKVSGMLTHNLGPDMARARDWKVTFEVAYPYGSSASNPMGGSWTSVAILNDDGGGYRILSPQNGTLVGDKIAIHRIDGGVATLIKMGSDGYKQLGWKKKNWPVPNLMPLQFTWDRATGTIMAYKGSGEGAVSVASIVDTTYKSFTKIVLTATDGFYIEGIVTAAPEFDNVVVEATIPPAPTLVQIN